MEEWKKYKLGDILADKGYIRGPFGSALKRGDMKSEGIPVYEQQHAIYQMRDFRFFIDEKKFQEMKRFQVNENDLVISCSGTVGKVTIISKDDPKGIISQALLILRVNPNIILPKYLQYFFISSNGYNSIISRSSGSVQVNIAKRDVIEAIPLSLPPLPTQQKIAAILSSLDDKIELNNKINTNLEQQAQALFKNWFVDFEPFGGKMPEGWKEIPLEELCTVVTKGTTPTTLGKKFTEIGINFIKGESILDNHTFDLQKISHIDDETNLMLKRSIIQPNDILFTIAGTLGRFAFIDETLTPANTNQAVGIIRANPEIISPYYLYSFFIGNWHNDYYTKRIQQAVQANLSLGTIKSLPIIIPDSQNLNKYTALIEPIFKQIKQLENENIKLANLRDTLLPKLMNGEIEV